MSVDAHGRMAHRMALATREQHIRREKATSNICTAQALLANIAAMYAVYHGPDGLQGDRASRVHLMAQLLDGSLKLMGLEQRNTISTRSESTSVRRRGSAQASAGLGINFRYPDERTIDIALNETVTTEDVLDILGVFASALNRPSPQADLFELPKGVLVLHGAEDLPASLRRSSAFMTHPVFNTHRSETEMMRYIRSLERRDLGLDTSMIPLGSCTMKLNPATAMPPLTWERFSRMHLFALDEQAEGYLQISASSRPRSARSSGWCRGLAAAQFRSRADHGLDGDQGLSPRPRRIRPGCRADPGLGDGTNPASAAMAGLRVVVVASAPNGNVDLDDLRRKHPSIANGWRA